MRKPERQELIAGLIRRQRLSSQAEVVTSLTKLGAKVTQATISRDLREMGVQKGSDREGQPRYILPAPHTRRDPEAALRRLLRDSMIGSQSAQNLVVLRVEPGAAPAIARSIDELEHPDIAGTVAGDDTILLVMPDTVRARKMNRYLTKLQEGQG